MLTILHDIDETDGNVEVASAEGIEVRAPHGAAPLLARRLIALGYDRATPVRLVRENPWIHGGPAHVSEITLALASRVDFFALADGEAAVAAAKARTRRSAVGR